MNSELLAIIILTYNESVHIKRCIESAKDLTENIYVIDSFSNDNTQRIVLGLGAKFYQHQWENNHSKQFNWGLEHLPIDAKWILRLDADEYFTDELIKEINTKLPNLPEEVSGVFLKRRVYFMDRWIKHGNYYPTYLLRIWRNGIGKYEERWMDEHIKLNNGKSVIFANDFIDNNINGLTMWINKHNNYATREAVDLLNIKYSFDRKEGLNPVLNSTQDRRKRWFKENLYSKLPLFIRPFIYFIYRYFFRLGFLDGVAGLIWHFLQGFWYRFLVDAKIYEIERMASKDHKNISEIIHRFYNIKIR